MAMKIVTVLGSPRPQGNSAALARRFLQTAAGLGADTSSVYELNRLRYRGCQACYACKKGSERCVIKDDLAAVLAAVEAADAVVLTTPVYYGDITSQLKGFIDRLYGFLVPDFHTNPRPSRLAPKKLAFILTQGNPDPALFADIFPRYGAFLGRMGFADRQLVRVCGVGPGSPAETVAEPLLCQADDAAHRLLGVPAGK